MRRPVRRAVDVDQAAAEADLAPEVADALDDPGDDGGQDVRAHVGLRVPQDLAPRARLDQRPEDQPVSRVARAGVELAVGEGPGAPESELDVALRVECALGLEALDGPGPPPRVVAALDEQGLEARLGERERGEQPRAPRAHHHRALEGARRRRDRGGPSGLRLLHGAHPVAVPLGDAAERVRLERGVRERDPRAQGEVHVALPARVDGPAVQGDRGDIGIAHAQQAPRLGAAGVEAGLFRDPGVEGDGDLRYLDHERAFQREGWVGVRPAASPRVGAGEAGPPTRPPPRRPRAGRRAMPTRG